MTDKEKKIKDLKYRIDNYIGIKDCSDRSISALLGEIATIKTETAESKKPKLRHGDVRWTNACDPIIFLGEDWYNHGVKLSGNGRSDETWLTYPHQFNIFDDLKAVAEPLDEFEIKSSERQNKLKGSFDEAHVLITDTEDGDYVSIAIENLHDFIANLTRVQNTIRGQ